MVDEKLEILDHIERSVPPWQRDRFTECGRFVRDVVSIKTADEIRAKVAKVGKQRAAFSTCMTCAERWRSHDGWEANPIAVVHRSTERGQWSSYFVRGEKDARSERVREELRAVALLVERHREEYDKALEDMKGTSSLAQARQAKRGRAR